MQKMACCCHWVAQSCLTLCHPVGCSPPGSSVHAILQARIQEWVAMPSSRGSSWPRDSTQVSCIAGRFFITEPPGKPHKMAFSHLNINMSRQGNYGRNVLNIFCLMSLSRRRRIDSLIEMEAQVDDFPSQETTHEESFNKEHLRVPKEFTAVLPNRWWRSLDNHVWEVPDGGKYSSFFFFFKEETDSRNLKPVSLSSNPGKMIEQVAEQSICGTKKRKAWSQSVDNAEWGRVFT